MYNRPENKGVWANLRHILYYTLAVPFVRITQLGLYSTGVWIIVRGRLALTGISTQRFSRITDALYVGGQIRGRGWELLQASGVTSIVNMRGESDDRDKGVDVDDAHYLHLPTVDDQPVALEDLKRGADWMQAQIDGGGVVYVHCAAGSGRAPSMGAAYLITHQAMTTDEALNTIRARRPFVMPMPSQLERLHEYEAWLKTG